MDLEQSLRHLGDYKKHQDQSYKWFYSTSYLLCQLTSLDLFVNYIELGKIRGKEDLGMIGFELGI